MLPPSSSPGSPAAFPTHSYHRSISPAPATSHARGSSHLQLPPSPQPSSYNNSPPPVASFTPSTLSPAAGRNYRAARAAASSPPSSLPTSPLPMSPATSSPNSPGPSPWVSPIKTR